MEGEAIATIFGKEYKTSLIKYSYTGKAIRFKKLLKYLLIAFIISWFIRGYLFFQLTNMEETLPLESLINAYKPLISALKYLEFAQFALFGALIVFLIPKINCLFLKIDGNKKDIILFKSIHRNETELMVSDINSKIKLGAFLSYPDKTSIYNQ
jgi:hypothetical protein